MKARIKSNGKIVEVISRFMPRKRNAASRDWVCNLSDGTCIDESQLEYIEESIGVLEEAADNHIRRVVDAAGHPGWDWTTQDIADAFIAGAKWQAEHAPLPEDTVLFNKGVAEGRRLAEEEQAGMFTIVALDAAQRAKEQMMREAVEGEVVQDLKGVNRVKSFGKIPEGLHFGDKVRIIIVKD